MAFWIPLLKTLAAAKSAGIEGKQDVGAPPQIPGTVQGPEGPQWAPLDYTKARIDQRLSPIKDLYKFGRGFFGG